jgi:ribosomal protein S18 acetylase RimI-like enzyme
VTGAADPAAGSGRPVAELSDGELEAQGTQAHATRNWVFLHGTAEQFARHTSRMLELEQEYLRRHPKRTWQGSGGAPAGRGDEAAALREALRGIVIRLDALAAEPAREPLHLVAGAADPVLAVLAAVAAAPGGRLHKLEVHQAAREAQLDRSSLAALYTAAAGPLLATDQQDRVITAAGRERLRQAGRNSGAPPPRSAAQAWHWQHQEHPVWDEDKQRVVGGQAAGIFSLSHAPGQDLADDWWAASDASGRIVAFGWMDVTWGEAEILLAVEPDARQAGLGSFVLDQLEHEAASRGLNYVCNVVAETHPDHDAICDWLGVRGYQGDAQSGVLRKKVPAPEPAATGTSAAPQGDASRYRVASAGADLGPGHEEGGGYVDVEDQQY